MERASETSASSGLQDGVCERFPDLATCPSKPADKSTGLLRLRGRDHSVSSGSWGLVQDLGARLRVLHFSKIQKTRLPTELAW